MKYITHRRFRNNGWCGRENIPYGTPLTLGRFPDVDGEFLFMGDRPIVAPHSQLGIEHFAQDEDGCGLIRGALTYAIAWAKRNGTGRFRFTQAERDMLTSQYADWLEDTEDSNGERWIIFNNAFYDANVPQLEELGRKLGIRVKNGRIIRCL